MKHDNDYSKTTHATQNKKVSKSSCIARNLWRFDMQKHVEKEHPEKECSAKAITSKAEKGILQKKQARVVNALSVKDHEKLNENESNCCQQRTFGTQRRNNGRRTSMERSQILIACR